jgi:hypothetical protein
MRLKFSIKKQVALSLCVVSQASVPTFSAVELCTFPTFIFRTVVMSLIATDRVTLKSKVTTLLAPSMFCSDFLDDRDRLLIHLRCSACLGRISFSPSFSMRSMNVDTGISFKR